MASSQQNKLRLPVLMYHEIHIENGGDYSIQFHQLAAQLEYLKDNGFTTISIKDYLNHTNNHTQLPPKPVLITFDDGYKTVATRLYPLLVQLKMKAAVFIVPSFTHKEDGANNKYLSIPEIKKISGDHIEWGLHSYDHFNFKKISVTAAIQDITRCIEWFRLYNIPMVEAFAFPYGGFPKFNILKRKRLFSGLHSLGVQLFLRIGNRMNYRPFKNKVLLQRIDITGTESMDTFGSYLEKGKR
jgi:peptidoglycan/xylan/chitin deacetylase (PgdA/CDA1 family)